MNCIKSVIYSKVFLVIKMLRIDLQLPQKKRSIPARYTAVRDDKSIYISLKKVKEGNFILYYLRISNFFFRFFAHLQLCRKWKIIQLFIQQQNYHHHHQRLYHSSILRGSYFAKPTFDIMVEMNDWFLQIFQHLLLTTNNQQFEKKQPLIKRSKRIFFFFFMYLKLEKEKELRIRGNEEVWSLKSTKRVNGIEKLRRQLLLNKRKLESESAWRSLRWQIKKKKRSVDTQN